MPEHVVRQRVAGVVLGAELELAGTAPAVAAEVLGADVEFGASALDLPAGAGVDVAGVDVAGVDVAGVQVVLSNPPLAGDGTTAAEIVP
jgi:hypothetical protein